MPYAVKRLSLGVALILLASVALLGMDIYQRRKNEGQTNVAIFQHISSPIMEEGVRGMIDGLKKMGFEDGKNYRLKKFNAEGDIATGNAIASAITTGQYRLVLTSSTPSMIAVANANKAGKTTQVFGLVADPFACKVGLNAAAPKEHPKHMIGQGCMLPVNESFELMRRCLPNLKRIGVAWNPAEANSQIFTGSAKRLAPKMGMEIIEASVENAAGVVDAINALVSKGAQVIWVGGDNTLIASLDSVIDLAKKAGLPVVSITPGKPDRGTLIELGLNFYEVGLQAGQLAGRVLKGEEVRNIPIEDVGDRVEHKLTVNLNALKGLKEPWQIPDDLVKEAKTLVDATGIHQQKGGK